MKALAAAGAPRKLILLLGVFFSVLLFGDVSVGWEQKEPLPSGIAPLAKGRQMGSGKYLFLWEKKGSWR